ncbi:unnamed protein product, partial [Medioppia subpectinata]
DVACEQPTPTTPAPSSNPKASGANGGGKKEGTMADNVQAMAMNKAGGTGTDKAAAGNGAGQGPKPQAMGKMAGGKQKH